MVCGTFGVDISFSFFLIKFDTDQKIVTGISISVKMCQQTFSWK